MKPFALDGSLALVTGGSRGIGLGAALALSEAGADVILIGRDGHELARATETVAQSGRRVHSDIFDLQNTQGISRWYRSVGDRFGTPNILVNAAGISRRGPAVDLTLDDWDAVMNLNAKAMFEVSRNFARELITTARSGRVINIASLMTAAARPGVSPYTASKGAVGQLTKALAIEWAQYGILVNAIAPGYIDTDLNRVLIADERFDAWVKERCPLKRWGKPEDVAWPIVFLASSAASFITGQIIYVDGGWLATF